MKMVLVVFIAGKRGHKQQWYPRRWIHSCRLLSQREKQSKRSWLVPGTQLTYKCWSYYYRWMMVLAYSV